ncbi:MAG: helix-turn-helix domain-containing protein [Pseudobutyrivibrio sp.]|nr:helix-turn-helix domain-containing protein [Pseudobutyrivibrio sp.]
MELGNRIKELRSANNINQDDLAEKLFVSRQTISNWENDKSYPDIHSVVLLSEIFNVSIDQLLKGDVERMEQIVTEQTQVDISKMNTYSKALLILMATLVISMPIMVCFIGMWFLAPSAVLIAVVLFFSNKIEKTKKEYDVQTYKEIIAFTKGETLTQTEKIQEVAKRPYQKVIVFVVSTVLGLAVGLGLTYFFIHTIGRRY